MQRKCQAVLKAMSVNIFMGKKVQYFIPGPVVRIGKDVQHIQSCPV